MIKKYKYMKYRLHVPLISKEEFELYLVPLGNKYEAVGVLNRVDMYMRHTNMKQLLSDVDTIYFYFSIPYNLPSFPSSNPSDANTFSLTPREDMLLVT